MLVVGAGGVAGWSLLRDRATIAAPELPTANATSSESTPAGGPASASAAPGVASTTKATIRVAPKGVHATVNGKEAPIVDGQLTIEGALGSVHEVGLELGGRRQVVKVALTSEGPSPDSVTLGKTPTTRPVGKSPATSTATTAAAPPTTAPAKPAPTPTRTGGVGAVDSFD
jgi:hypothetical protein